MILPSSPSVKEEMRRKGMVREEEYLSF